MKSTMVVVFGLLLVKAAFGQNWVEERTYISGGVATPRIDGLLTCPIKGSLGGFVWFQTQKTYSEAYGGITYSLKPWLQFALGSGIEQAKDPARVGGYVWMGNGKDSLLFIPEYGGSGFWWKLEANRKLSKSVGLGLLTERFKGTGPRMEYKIPKTRFMVWAAPMLERGAAIHRLRVNMLIGIRCHL